MAITKTESPRDDPQDIHQLFSAGKLNGIGDDVGRIVDSGEVAQDTGLIQPGA